MKYQLEDVFEFIRNGATIKQDDKNEGYPITRIETIANSFIDLNKMGYAGIDTIDKYKQYLLKDGDILMSHINSEKHLGKTAIYENLDIDIIHGMNLLCLRPNLKYLIPKYTYYYFKHSDFKTQLPRIIKKSVNQASFSVSDLKKFDIYVPKLEVQQKIVEALNKAKDIIDKRKAQLEGLDELVKSRFIEMFGDPIANEMNWTKSSLINICESIVDCPHSTPSYTSANTGYMCIRTSIIKKNKLLWDQIEYIPKDEFEKRIQRRKPQKGDIVYSREGAILGIAAIIDRDVDVALGQRLMLLSPNRKYCCSEFLCVTMNFDSFLNRALEKIGGSASPHINVGDIKVFNLIVPPIELQNQFATFVNQVDKLKFEMQQSLTQLENNFNVIMQKAFNGELFN